MPAAELPELLPKFDASHPKAAAWDAVVAKIRAKVGTEGNPFRRFTDPRACGSLARTPNRGERVCGSGA